MALIANNWGEPENGPRPTPDPQVSAVVPAMGVTVQMPMACPPEAFWDLITSVERIGEFSPECAEAWWVDGFPAHAVGGRFEGRNRREAEGDTYEWTRPCDVVAYDPPRPSPTPSETASTARPRRVGRSGSPRANPGASWNSNSSTFRTGSAGSTPGRADRRRRGAHRLAAHHAARRHDADLGTHPEGSRGLIHRLLSSASNPDRGERSHKGGEIDLCEHGERNVRLVVGPGRGPKRGRAKGIDRGPQSPDSALRLPVQVQLKRQDSPSVRLGASRTSRVERGSRHRTLAEPAR